MDAEVRLPAPGGRIHMVGVAGAGMRGLALVLAEAGFCVTGCDRDDDCLPELEARGVGLEQGHHPRHAADVELVVCSAAVPQDMPELDAARAAGIPVLKRAQAMGAWLAAQRVVGIAGTHGKTTITAMAGLACEAAGLDPTVLVGGKVDEWGAFARHGRGDVAVVEADEYDRSFLELDPWLAVVSGVEPEHLESYGSWEALLEAYADFAGRAASQAGVVYCADDRGATELCSPIGGRSYGFSAGADYRVVILDTDGDDQRCGLRTSGGALEFHLGCPGEHNVQNAAAALAVALELGSEADRIAGSLATFSGVARRLQLLAMAEDLIVVDDYAHHPTEVRASLRAIRGRYPDRRVVAVFQPHLFSRTRRFATDFAEALAEADLALVLPIYGAREAPIPGITSALIVAAGSQARLASRDEVVECVREIVRGGREPLEVPAVLVFMGAGDVTEIAHESASEVTGHAVGA